MTEDQKLANVKLLKSNIKITKFIIDSVDYLSLIVFAGLILSSFFLFKENLGAALAILGIGTLCVIVFWAIFRMLSGIAFSTSVTAHTALYEQKKYNHM